MTIRIKTQRDYLLTEASIELPCDISALDYLMKASKGSGKITAVYEGGGVLGVNVEQKTRIRDAMSDKVRELIGVESKEFNGG
jgi:hypothetical protein